MKMKTFFILLFFIIAIKAIPANDTISVMQYNLLHFGNLTSYCNLSNNDPEEKKAWLKTIFDHYLPDVLSVNEISPDQFYHDLILDQVINTSGRDHYAGAYATNFAGSDIINMLYYNTQKVGLAGQDVVEHWLRDINVYKLYHQSAALQATGDTIFFYLFSAHFKAGTTAADKTQRAAMAQAVLDYIANENITAPCLMVGDLNLQNSSEPAWQALTGQSSSFSGFIDPAGQVGNWNKNPDFVTVHNQSTRTIADGCGAIGGMDDRFDFILINDTLLSSTGKLRYIPQSFRTPGQDGLRLDGSLIDPPNFSAPGAVIDAMYNFSDHLPVIIDLVAEIPQPAAPPEWEYTQSSNSHIVIIPSTINPQLNGSAIKTGDVIGVFFVDNGTEKCAGYSVWTGTQNIAIVAYGDDFLTPEKDGFDNGEPFIFKLYSASDDTEFYADVSMDESMPLSNGTFSVNGISALTRFEAQYLQLFTIEIPMGWSGISSFINPNRKSPVDIFGNAYNNIDFLFDGVNISYPAVGLEEIKYWESKKGYIIKTNTSVSVTFEGMPQSDLTIQLVEGWNIFPVLTPCFIPITQINASLNEKIEVAVAVAGVEVYWPAYDIETLSLLVPGKAYLVKVSENCSFTFEECQ
jgi:endonuclease/exonuclease/phosphatase family metal-dependent hydrolase